MVMCMMLVTGYPGTSLEEPMETAYKVPRTRSSLEFPMMMVPFPGGVGVLVTDYDMEVMHDLSVAVPVPPPILYPDLYIPLPEVEAPAYSGDPIRLDVLFCLDTTGSMGDEIAVAKETILTIVEAVAAGNPPPDVRYGLVIYRDLDDSYVTIVHDFMAPEDLASVLQIVEAGEGGDYEESVSEALTRSVLDVTWDMAASRAIYLIGDAPPHTDYANGFDHVHAAHLAADMGIVINAIGCSGIQGNEEEFQEVVDLTGGQFVYLNYTSEGGGYGHSSYSKAYDSGLDGCIPCCAVSVTRGGGDNNLDDVLTEMLRNMAKDEGVEYDD